MDVELFQVGGDVAGDAMVDVVTRTQERGDLAASQAQMNKVGFRPSTVARLLWLDGGSRRS